MKPFVLIDIKQREVDPHSLEQTANVTLYGKTEDGKSCCVEVVEFYPYFYFYPGKNFDPSTLETVKKSLERQVQEKVSENRKKRLGKAILTLEAVQRTEFFGYNENPTTFIKVTMAHPNLITTLRGLLGSGLDEEINGFKSFVTYESNILFIDNWIIDKGTSGGGWLEIREDDDPTGVVCLKSQGLTRCDHHYQVKKSHIFALSDRTDHAPITVFGFDIECAGRKGKFPEPEIDKVIQISCITKIYGAGPIKTGVNCVLVLGTSEPSEKDWEIINFSEERDLLLAFRDIINNNNVDFFTGYNICSFDFPYLINRAKALKIDKQFCQFSLRTNELVGLADTRFESKAHGVRESKNLKNCDGRVTLDMFQIIQRDHKLRSYTLNFVSAHFLGEQKADVPHSQITPMYEGNDKDRRDLAYYCWKDSWLPLQIFEKLMIFYNYFEMARVCLIPISYIVERGQSIKVMTQILSAARKRGFVVPNKDDLNLGKDEDDTFEGATVIKPDRGFHTKPVATLDFSSLYPSIMMAHNLCYSTLLRKSSDLKKIPSKYYAKTPLEANKKHPNGVHFLKSNLRKGVLPEILEKLIGARKKAKRDLAAETDPFKKGILDGRQLALKISANSVYGFTGAAVGKLPCFEISASVTAYGRQMIDITSKTVVEHYNKKNGYDFDAVVIYGDTDSVMVVFGYENTLEGRIMCMKLGKEASELVTKKFISPINLEFEKLLVPYLLINKKRYAGYHYTRPEKPDFLNAKGIESVRRDSSYFCKETIEKALKLLMDNPDNIEIAVNFVKEQLSLLVQNKLDPSRFAISKKLAPPDSYKSPQPHLTLYNKILKRSERGDTSINIPAIGDRIPYVITPGFAKSKVHEKAEDPLYAIKNGIGLDFEWYLEKQLKKPLTRIFEYVVGAKNLPSIFTGEHTRKRVILTNQTGIAKFCNTIPKCLSCKTTLKRVKEDTRTKNRKVEIEFEGSSKIEKTSVSTVTSVPAICDNCREHEPKIFKELMDEHNRIRDRVTWLTENCMTCKNEPNTKGITCANHECKFYFERYKKIDDCQRVRKKLKRFNGIILDPLDKRSIGISDLEW